MDHKDITIFLELVRCRNISKTAENLYLSQSAVSSRLKALEEEMGCQLVHRHQRKHLRPSAGRVLAAIHRTASGKEDTDKGVRLQRHV